MTVPIPNCQSDSAQGEKEDRRPDGRHVLIEDVVSHFDPHQQAC